MTKSEQQVRADVSQAYAQAVSKPSEDASPCCAPVQKGVVVKLAGYTSEELGALPADAVVNSFGCGNPLAFSEIGTGEVVLDLGSGAGIDILLAAKKVGPTGRAIGIDMTDEMLNRAKENIAASGMDNVEVRKGIIEELPVEDASVDWVISNCVINLSPEKAKVFAEIARVLKPGGRMLVSDIVAEELPPAVREDQALYSSCISGAVSEAAYLEGLQQAGLADAEVRERIHYDESQLKAFIESELADTKEATGCCGGGNDCGDDGGGNRGNLVSIGGGSELARELLGKVWSAKIFARKPAG